MKDFSGIIDKVLHNVIIPLLPLYICGTFVDMTYSGKTFVILGILWKVFLVVILMHLICILLQFMLAGTVSKKNPFALIKNQLPGYTTALGTQSSAATIPVNLKCAEADGVCEQIRNFVVPLCANIHMAGSMITITACATAVCLMNQLPISLATVIPFIMTLGIAMVASPGAPRRFYHDRSSLPVHGLWRYCRRSQRPYLRHHGSALYYTGFLRDCLQCFRRQCHRCDRRSIYHKFIAVPEK